jgi:hypothetical protein
MLILAIVITLNVNLLPREDPAVGNEGFAVATTVSVAYD